MTERLNFINALNHLSKLNESPFALQKVAYWLYEYNDLYIEILNQSRNPCGICMQNEAQGLPYDCLEEPEYCTQQYSYFTDFYKRVEYGVDVQRYDSVCSIALSELNDCKDLSEQKVWLERYFDLGYNKLAIFSYDHLDYRVKKGEVVHPHFGNSPIGEFGVCINRKYYENLIEFEKVFRELFYEKEVYPEKLEEIRKEMEKIVLPMIPIPKID